MPYTPTTWNAGVAPGISAANLNNIETQYAQAVADCVNTAGDTMTGHLNMATGTQIIHSDVVATKQQYYSGYARGVASGTLWDMTGQFYSLYRAGDTPGVSTPTIRIDAATKTFEMWTNLYFPANYSFVMEHGTANPVSIRADGSHNFVLTNTSRIYMLRPPGDGESYIMLEGDVTNGAYIRTSAGSVWIRAWNAARTAGGDYFKVTHVGNNGQFDMLGKIVATVQNDAHTFVANSFNVAAFMRGGGTPTGDIISFASAGSFKGSISISGETCFFNSFTGAHGTILKTGQERPPKFGVVVATGEVFNQDASKPFPYISSTTMKNNPAVYGIWTDSKAGSTEYGNPTEQVASIGLYLARVTDEEGDIATGDLLATSSRKYEACKQSTNMVRAYTLGKALEPVAWADVEIDPVLGYKWKAIATALYSA